MNISKEKIISIVDKIKRAEGLSNRCVDLLDVPHSNFKHIATDLNKEIKKLLEEVVKDLSFVNESTNDNEEFEYRKLIGFC